MKRLQPIIDSNVESTWEDWIKEAYRQRISLSATGFYRTPDIGYSFDTNTGKPFNYFTYGVACTEVEIDCLTGDHEVRLFCFRINKNETDFLQAYFCLSHNHLACMLGILNLIILAKF